MQRESVSNSPGEHGGTYSDLQFAQVPGKRGKTSVWHCERLNDERRKHLEEQHDLLTDLFRLKHR